MFYKTVFFTLWAKLYSPRKAKGCARFETKITMAKKVIQNLQVPTPCKTYILADRWYWVKELVKVCRQRGYHNDLAAEIQLSYLERRETDKSHGNGFKAPLVSRNFDVLIQQ